MARGAGCVNRERPDLRGAGAGNRPGLPDQFDSRKTRCYSRRVTAGSPGSAGPPACPAAPGRLVVGMTHEVVQVLQAPDPDMGLGRRVVEQPLEFPIWPRPLLASRVTASRKCGSFHQRLMVDFETPPAASLRIPDAPAFGQDPGGQRLLDREPVSFRTVPSRFVSHLGHGTALRVRDRHIVSYRGPADPGQPGGADRPHRCLASPPAGRDNAPEGEPHLAGTPRQEMPRRPRSTPWPRFPSGTSAKPHHF